MTPRRPRRRNLVSGPVSALTGARLVVLTACMIAGAAACGTETLGPADQTVDLSDRTYLSTKVTEGGSERPLVSGSRVSLRFTDDDRLIAGAGCNSMTGPVSVADGKLVVDDLATTEMGCDPARHEQDNWVHTFLTSKPVVTVKGNTLVLAGDKTRIELLDRSVADPDRPLEGTRWTLTTMIEGEVASTSRVADRAFLQFSKGRVTGADGCNQLGGPAKVTGSTIEFGAITSTRMACLDKDRAAVQRIVQAVLRGSVTYEIEARTLTLEGSGGKSLQFSAGK